MEFFFFLHFGQPAYRGAAAPRATLLIMRVLEVSE